MKKTEFEAEFFKKNPPGVLKKLQKFTVGLAGAGGLGSNVAVSLVRAGIQKLIIADFDKIELSNLNRQQFFHDQVGKLKVKVLKENLLRINPYLKINEHALKITQENIKNIFGNADILIEAFDKAEEKAMLARTWAELFPDRFLIMGSGLAGTGNIAKLHIECQDKIIICGDRETESNAKTGLCAPRVAIVANLQASTVLEILLTKSTLQKVSGIWNKRRDLPDFNKLRKNWDRKT